MAAHPLRPIRASAARTDWLRLALVVAGTGAVGAADLGWKATALAAGHDLVAVDTPTTVLRPVSTLLVAAIALLGVLWLPRVCLPGGLLVLGGAASNLASLALWRSVPDPLHLDVGGGALHFNLADLCIWTGSLVFLAGAYWALWRLPDEPFA